MQTIEGYIYFITNIYLLIRMDIYYCPKSTLALGAQEAIGYSL